MTLLDAAAHALGMGEGSAAPLLTPAQLQALGWADPAEWAPILSAACARHEITTTQRLAMFLANVGHESGGGRRLVESLSYTAERLGQVFGYRVTPEALACCRRDGHPADEQRLANILYGGAWGAKNLGNTQPDDGWRFRGKGLLQVTGRRNYQNLAVLLGTTAEKLSAAMESRAGAAETAAMWWRLAGCNKLADAGAGNLAMVRKVVNGGAVGLEDVADRYKAALAVLRAA